MRARFAWTILLCLVAINAHADVRYRVFILDEPIDTNLLFTVANDISDTGWVTGYGQSHHLSPNGGLLTTWAYHPDTGYTNLGTFPGSNTRGISINDGGQIAVCADNEYFYKALRYTPGLGFEDLGNLGSEYGEHVAWGINRHGQVVGRSELPDGSLHAFRYTDGIGLEDLGTFGGSSSAAHDINDLGWVCGRARTSDDVIHAFVDRNDGNGMVDLGPGAAASINNNGVMSGGNLTSRLVLFREDVVVPIWQFADYYALGMMNEGNICVGEFLSAAPSGGAIYSAYVASEAEGLLNLNQFIPTNSPWKLLAAASVNNHGQIVGAAFNTVARREVAFRLDPIPPSLTIQRSATNLVVSWTPNWPGLYLESTETISSPNWQRLETAATNVITPPMSGASRFFRLNTNSLAGLCCAPQ